MQFIKPDININFIGVRKFAYAASLAMILISIASLVIQGGPDYGIDFAGGYRCRQIGLGRQRYRATVGATLRRKKRKRISDPNARFHRNFRRIHDTPSG